MSFFRRKPNPARMVARTARPEDRHAVTRLLHSADRRYLTSGYAEVPDILAADPSSVLEVDGLVVGAASFGWRAAPVAWLRTLLLQSDLPATSALDDLSTPLYAMLRAEGITLAAVTLDEWNEPWLRKPLQHAGYRPVVEVVGYEKQRLDRPAAGNQVVGIRRGHRDDMHAVLALDAACFPLPWVKGPEIIGPALLTSPCFLIAEFAGSPVGYAFLSEHQGGRLLHLVRIAVAPAYQGRGVGVRLLAEIVDFAAGSPADFLTLNTQADNYAAQRLYEWFGFRRTGDRQTVLGLDIPA